MKDLPEYVIVDALTFRLWQVNAPDELAPVLRLAEALDARLWFAGGSVALDLPKPGERGFGLDPGGANAVLTIAASITVFQGGIGYRVSEAFGRFDRQFLNERPEEAVKYFTQKVVTGLITLVSDQLALQDPDVVKAEREYRRNLSRTRIRFPNKE